MKILLVEDSKFLRISTERVLKAAGYEVISAADGEEAIRLVREQCPALILLDVMLPKISGLEVLRTLKNDAVTSAIPVVMLTALSQKMRGKWATTGPAISLKSPMRCWGKGLTRSWERLIEYSRRQNLPDTCRPKAPARGDLLPWFPAVKERTAEFTPVVEGSTGKLWVQRLDFLPLHNRRV